MKYEALDLKPKKVCLPTYLPTIQYLCINTSRKVVRHHQTSHPY
jgi:hypothetical protein